MNEISGWSLQVGLISGGYFSNCNGQVGQYSGAGWVSCWPVVPRRASPQPRRMVQGHRQATVGEQRGGGRADPGERRFCSCNTERNGRKRIASAQVETIRPDDPKDHRRRMQKERDQSAGSHEWCSQEGGEQPSGRDRATGSDGTRIIVCRNGASSGCGCIQCFAFDRSEGS